MAAQWASLEVGEARRELRMNPAPLELRERRKLNNSTGLCIEHASCDPLPQIKMIIVPVLGLVRRKFSGEEKLGGN